MPIITDRPDRMLMQHIGWDVNDNGCWIWRGPYDGTRAKLNREVGNINASRAMWIQTYGDVHPLLEVCHACHNPACVNVDHLYLANHRRNMGDAGSEAPILTYGRAKNPAAQAVRPNPLTEDDRKRMRYLAASRLLHTREIAKLFDVSVSRVRAAINEREGS
jgi:hypothetical protein